MKEYKIVHFTDDFDLNEINEALSFSDEVIYYTRNLSEKNEFHIINHKEGEFTITPFVTQLFNFYNKNENLSNLVKEAKVKGNDNFAIIVNINDKLIEQLKKDLNTLLKK